MISFSFFITKINLIKIVREHFKTLKNLENKKISIIDIIFFIILPAFLSILISFKIDLKIEKVSLVLTAFSIFIGFLFNLLILLYDLLNRSREKDEILIVQLEEKTNKDRRDKGELEFLKDKKKLLNELYKNITYVILISILIVILCMIFVFEIDIFSNYKFIVKKIISGLILFLSINFVASLLMVLKRINTLLTLEFEK